MVSVSLRQNQAGTPDQNTPNDQAATLPEDGRFALAAQRNRAGIMVLVQQPFYRHPNLGPGAPLVELIDTGVTAGFYDWAGRRLFLPDGEPDPACPGAYRYQHNPTACDVDAPDSDPRSPRYEPQHLRHQPGDTWLIDHDRPHDPFDPGPYGTLGWYQDQRTGRHRRDETPDPLPAEDWAPPKNAWYPGIESRTGLQDQTAASQAPSRSDRTDPPRPNPRPGPGRSRRQFWGEPEANADVDASLREQAWGRFMTDSAPLAAAHTAEDRPRPRRQTAIEREAGGAWALWIALAKWLFALIRSTRNDHRQGRTSWERQHRETNPGPGSRFQNRPRVATESAPPLVQHPRNRPVAGSTAMARAVAGAQRARAGVPAWA